MCWLEISFKSYEVGVATNKSKPLNKTTKQLPMESNGKKVIVNNVDKQSKDSDNAGSCGVLL